MSLTSSSLQMLFQLLKRIFDMSTYLYQLYSIAISNNLRTVFNKNFNNLISFWDYLSSIKQFLYLLVNKKSKHLKINPIFLYKSLCQNSKQQTWFYFLSFTFILFFLFFFILFFIFILLFVILNLDKGVAIPVTSHVTIT